MQELIKLYDSEFEKEQNIRETFLFLSAQETCKQLNMKFERCFC